MDQKPILLSFLFLTAIVSTPGAMAQTDAEPTAPSACVTVSIFPPAVFIDPACLPSPVTDPLSPWTHGPAALLISGDLDPWSPNVNILI